MSDVEFSEEEAYKAESEKMARTMEKKSVSKLASLPVRLGLAKDATGANIVLVTVAILAALAGVVVFLIAR